jgi:hypothetical protein
MLRSVVVLPLMAALLTPSGLGLFRETVSVHRGIGQQGSTEAKRLALNRVAGIFVVPTKNS